MRIIAGSAKGVQLQAPEGLDTRPTTDKVREAVFGSLQFEIRGANCLDLFAGTGAMGIEALSRGASRCVFVDNDRRAIHAIEKNIAAARVADRARVMHASFKQAIARIPQPVDFVFLDPPYASGLYQPAVDALLQAKLLDMRGKVVAEHDGNLALHGWKEIKCKRYGKIYVSYLIPEVFL